MILVEIEQYKCPEQCVGNKVWISIEILDKRILIDSYNDVVFILTKYSYQTSYPILKKLSEHKNFT